MKKKRNIIFISVALTISFIIMLLIFLFIISDKKDFSDTENRNLRELPSFSFERLKSGDFISEFEEYLADHFPFRNEFMFLKTSVLKFIGQEKIGELYLAEDGYLLEEYNVKPSNTKIPIKTLNRFYDELPEGTKMNLMLVPTSVEIYNEKLPKFSTNTSQKDVIDFVYDNIKFGGVDVYNVFDILKDNLKLYYKTDHHWTTLGAYLGYLSYIVSIGGEFSEAPGFEKVTEEFYGTFYSKLIDNTLETEEMYKMKDDDMKYIVKNVATNEVTNSLYEEKWLNEKDKYSYFLGQNQALLEIENKSNQNGKKIVVIKDSYANAMIPFIARDYQYVSVIDPRMYKLKISDYIKQNAIDEVLLVYNMKTVETDLGISSIR